MENFKLVAVWVSSDDKDKDKLDPSNTINCVLIDEDT
jgi:hypothetical protein